MHRVGSIQRVYSNELIPVFGFEANRIAQRSSIAFELHLHPVAIHQHYAFSETERVGSKEMNMHMTRHAMLDELEVMMLKVRQTVRHILLACLNHFLPQQFAIALNRDLTLDRAKVSSNHKFWTDAALAQL